MLIAAFGQDGLVPTSLVFVRQRLKNGLEVEQVQKLLCHPHFRKAPDLEIGRWFFSVMAGRQCRDAMRSPQYSACVTMCVLSTDNLVVGTTIY